MIEKMLQLVSDTIDGQLIVCDDGFVIEVKNPTLWMKADEDGKKSWSNNQGAADYHTISGVKFLFDEDGRFETVQFEGN